MKMKTTKYRAPLCSILPCGDGGTFPVSVAASSTCALCRMCAHSTGWAQNSIGASAMRETVRLCFISLFKKRRKPVLSNALQRHP